MRRIPAIISSILLAAHFLRDGQLVIALVCLGMPLLLVSLTSVRLRVLQGFLVLGAGVWVVTGLGLATDRLLSAQPWLRLALIMTAVSAFTLWSAWLLESETMRNHSQPEIPASD